MKHRAALLVVIFVLAVFATAASLIAPMLVGGIPADPLAMYIVLAVAIPIGMASGTFAVFGHVLLTSRIRHPFIVVTATAGAALLGAVLSTFAFGFNPFAPSPSGALYFLLLTIPPTVAVALAAGIGNFWIRRATPTPDPDPATN